MATTVGYFQIINPQVADWLGGLTANAADTLRNGLLAKLNSAGKLVVCSADDRSSGIAWSNRTKVYAPTSAYLAADEEVTLATGHIRALVDSSFFYTQTLPGFAALLYTAAGGLMDTNGAAAGFVGKVIKTSEDVRDLPNTTKTVVMVELEFDGRNMV